MGCGMPHFSSHRKSLISTICLCLSVFNNFISLIKLSVDDFDKFTFATHFIATNCFVSYKNGTKILFKRLNVSLLNNFVLYVWRDVQRSSFQFQ